VHLDAAHLRAPGRLPAFLGASCGSRARGGQRARQRTGQA
jgi:hypothetical protein